MFLLKNGKERKVPNGKERKVPNGKERGAQPWSIICLINIFMNYDTLSEFGFLKDNYPPPPSLLTK